MVVLFAASVLFAGLVADDPVITGAGVAILATGLGLFVWRQIKHAADASDTEAKAGIVTVKAPAALVAVVVGSMMVLVGRGALTLGNVADEAASPAGGSDSAETAPPPATSPEVVEPAPTTTTTAPATTTPPSTRPPTTSDFEGDLPFTGWRIEMFAFGLVAMTGGLWLVEAAEGKHLRPLAGRPLPSRP